MDRLAHKRKRTSKAMRRQPWPIVRAQILRGTEAPAVALELRARSVILNVGRELERLSGFLWRGDEPEKLTRLAPEIFFAAPLDIFQAARGPVSDRCENGRGQGTTTGFPEIGYDWLTRGKPFQIVC